MYICVKTILEVKVEILKFTELKIKIIKWDNTFIHCAKMKEM